MNIHLFIHWNTVFTFNITFHKFYCMAKFKLGQIKINQIIRKIYNNAYYSFPLATIWELKYYLQSHVD